MAINGKYFVLGLAGLAMVTYALALTGILIRFLFT